MKPLLPLPAEDPRPGDGGRGLGGPGFVLGRGGPSGRPAGDSGGRAWNRNPRVDERLRLLGAGRRLRIALDGTEWHPDLWWPRAIPVQGAAFRKRPIFRSPNGWEHTFLRLLVHTLRETGRTAAFIGSRGSSFCGIRRPPGRRPQGLRRNPRGPALAPLASPPRAGGRPPAGQGRPGPRGLGPGAGGTRVGPTPSRTSWPCMTGAWASGIPRAAASAEFRTPEYLARFTLLLGTAVGQAVAQATPASRRVPASPCSGRASGLPSPAEWHLPSPQLRVFACRLSAQATS